ncbi:MAG: trigger factor [Candidatus Azobacteroides sp.]|nr:trigger factor [Candidatus Azobacteroides sp.]
MNITIHNIDSVNAKVTVAVTKEDYQTQVTKILKDIRKTAVIDGFRKGNVPASRIQAIYGKSVLIDEVNKLVSEKLRKYLVDNQIRIIGEPLLDKEEQKDLNFNSQEDFEFVFDLGLQPKMDIRLTKNDLVPYYRINVSDEMVDARIQNIALGYGEYKKVEEIGKEDAAKGILTELNEDDTVKEGGIHKENVYIFPKLSKDEEETNKFLGVQLNQLMVFNPYKMYGGHETELSALLEISKDEVKNHRGDFSFLVTEISRFEKAELNQELFDRLYGPGKITSEEELRDQLRLVIASSFLYRSDLQFYYNVKQLLLKRASDILLPDEFIKRWLLETGRKDNKDEGIDQYYQEIREDLKYSLIVDQCLEEYDIVINDSDIRQAAMDLAKGHANNHGLSNISDSALQSSVDHMMEDEETFQMLEERVKVYKLINLWKRLVTFDIKEISEDEFNQMRDAIISNSQEEPAINPINETI